MGKLIYLNVRTVPAFDSYLMRSHTAYTVSCDRDEEFMYASAWTLKDAVQLFRNLYGITEDSVIKFNRPFRPQCSVRHHADIPGERKTL
jgi:hypothetical protein